MCKCKTKYCRNKAKRGGVCYKCERKRTIEANPYRYWWQVNKDNAKRRGKFWKISFEYWVQFCDETGYLSIKGRGKYDASIDCKKNELGYVDGNLQSLTVSDNASKGVKRITYDYETNTFNLTNISPIQKANEQPF